MAMKKYMMGANGYYKGMMWTMKVFNAPWSNHFPTPGFPDRALAWFYANGRPLRFYFEGVLCPRMQGQA